MKRNFWIGIALGLAAIGLSDGPQAQTVHTDYVDGALFIRLKNRADFAVKSGESRLLNAARFNFLRVESKAFGVQPEVRSLAFDNNPVLSRTIAVTIDSIEKIDAFIERISRYEDVELVEKRPLYEICGVKSEGEDPFYAGDYAAHKWHLNIINTDSAWKLASGKPEIKVAVIDNAVWGAHEDLQLLPENQYTVYNQTEGSSAPPADVDQSYNCTSTRQCPAYDWSHGTHCAGNVGAIRNNGIGVAAVGSGVTVMGVSCTTPSTPNSVTYSFEGVRWAAEHGADVISMSWGSYQLPSETEQELLKSCYEKGIILVAAAGNNSVNTPFYPAASPYVISVGSVNSDKKFSNQFSNYGKWVDILSPGGFRMLGSQETKYSVLSTTFCTNQNYRINMDASLEGQYYDGFYGTSMATPVAASLCGLLLSVDPTLNTHTMRELLTSTAQIIDGNASRIRDGSGLIDAFAAVKTLLNSRPMPTNVRYTIIPPKSVTISWDAPQTENGTAQVAYYRVYRNGTLVQDQLTETVFNDNTLQNGNYTYSVEAVYDDNTTSLRNGIDFNVPTYREVKVEIQPDTNWGRVLGAGFYIDGDTVKLTAVPTPGHSVVRWHDGREVVSRDSVYRFAAIYDVTLTVTFRENVANENRMASMPLNIYPNPTDDMLHVENLPEGDYEGGVYDLQGRLLIPLHVQGGATLEIPVARLTKGTYIVKLTASDGKVRMAKCQKL